MWICWNWDEVLYYVVGNLHIRHGFLPIEGCTLFLSKCFGLEMGMTRINQIVPLPLWSSNVFNCLNCSHSKLSNKKVLSSRIEKWYLVGLLMSP